MNAEYARKAGVAAEMACYALVQGGIDGMHADLAQLRRSDADLVILAEYERRYRNELLAATPVQS